MLLSYKQFKALQFLLAIITFGIASRALQMLGGYYEFLAIKYPRETVTLGNFWHGNYTAFLIGIVAGLLCLFSLEYNTKPRNILKFVLVILLLLCSWIFTQDYYSYCDVPLAYSSCQKHLKTVCYKINEFRNIREIFRKKDVVKVYN